ncbi:MAG: hypothetical protein ACOCSI_03700 [Desulfohalobiaceae bacterium]
MDAYLTSYFETLYGKLELQQQLSPKRPTAGRPSARGKIDIMSIDSHCDNDHDFDLLCPPLAVVVAVVIVIDILTNTEDERRSPFAVPVEVFRTLLCLFRA